MQTGTLRDKTKQLLSTEIKGDFLSSQHPELCPFLWPNTSVSSETSMATRTPTFRSAVGLLIGKLNSIIPFYGKPVSQSRRGQRDATQRDYICIDWKAVWGGKEGKGTPRSGIQEFICLKT